MSRPRCPVCGELVRGWQAWNVSGELHITFGHCDMRFQIKAEMLLPPIGPKPEPAPCDFDPH